jgi:hypothetical protein
MPAVPVPPFTIFLRSGGEASEDDHAVPNGALEGDIRDPLDRLRKAFEARAPRTRIRFLAEYAPRLASTLRVEDMIEERPSICSPARPSP